MLAQIAKLFLSAALVGAVLFVVVRTPRELAKKIWLVCFAVVLGGGVTMMVAHSFVAKWAFRGDNPQDGLLYLVDGTAQRPFVYRRLAPEIVGWTTRTVLERAPSQVVSFAVEQSPLKRYRASWEGGESWTPRKAVAFHAAYVLFWLCLFGSLIVGAALLRKLRGCSVFESFVTACLAMCLLPLMFVNGGYLYDAPELFLWITLLLVVSSAPVVVAPLVFFLMVMNKESALLAVPALLPILAQRFGLRAGLAWTAGLGMIGVGWVLYVHARFAPQPGGAMAFLLGDNLRFWSSPANYVKFGTPFSPVLPAPRGGNLLLLLALLLPIRFGWKSARQDFRRATLILAGILVPVFLVSGSTDEIRGLSLLLPLLMLLAVEGVHCMLRSEQVPAATPEADAAGVSKV